MAEKLEVIITAKDKASKTITNVGKTLTKTFVIGAGAAIAGVAGLGLALGNMTADALAVDNVTNTFDSLVQSIGGDSVDAMNQLKEATGGMIGEADIMASANRFMSMGLADSIEKAAELSNVASQLGIAMGTGPTEAMESFALMLANQSLPRLDTFGISSGRVRLRIEELTKANKDMTREQAFTIATLEEAQKTMGKVGDQFGTTQAEMERTKAMFADTKLEIGRAFIPVVGNLMEMVNRLADFALPWLTETLGGLADKFANVSEFVNEFVQNVSSGEEPFATFINLATDYGIISEDMATTIENVVNWLIDFKDQLIEITEPVIEAVTNFVSFKDVLMAVGLLIASFVIPTVLSLVASMLPIIATVAAVTAIVALLRKAWEEDWLGMRTTLLTFWEESVKPAFEEVKEWLQVNIPIAIDILKDYWENRLKPAIETVWNWLSTVLIPFFQDVIVPWLQEKIPEAIQTLSNFWTNTLKPAIDEVYKFLVDSVIPIIEDVFDWLKEKIPEAIQTASDFWTETLQPALEDVWEVITTDIIPAIEDIWNWLGDLADKASEVAGGALATLRGVFDNIASAVSNVIGFVEDLLAKLPKIKLPPILQPGSPSPFEQSLLGIISAMKELNEVMPVMPQQMQWALATSQAQNRLGSSPSRQMNINLTANYKQFQSESSIIDDLKLLEMVYGR